MSAQRRVIELPPPYYGYRDVVTFPVKHRESPIIPAILIGVAVFLLVLAVAKRQSSPKKPAKAPASPPPDKSDMEKRFANSDQHEREIERQYPDRSEVASWPSKK